MGWLAALSGLGPGMSQGIEGALRQQDMRLRDQALRTQLQQEQEQRKNQTLAGLAVLRALAAGGGGPAAVGGFAGPQPPMPGQSSQPMMPGGTQPGYAPPLPGAPGPPTRLMPQPTEQQIVGSESGGRPFVGWGGTGKPPIDLSNAPLDPQGFPTTPPRPGPRGPSTAGGLYGITKTNWDAMSPEVAKTIGHTPQFTNTQDQRAVYQAMRAKYGARPWTVWSAGGGTQATGGEGGAAPPAQPPPPSGYDLSGLAKELLATNPGLDGKSIFEALDQYAGLMDKRSQQDWERYKFQADEQDKSLSRSLESRRLDSEDKRLDAMIGARAATEADKGWQIQQLPDGRMVRVQPSTGQVQPLDLPAGTAKQGTASQGTVNPEQQKMMAQGIANYQLPPLTGWALRSPSGQAVMAEVMQLNPQYDATKFTGKSHGAMSVGSRSAQLAMNTNVAEEEIPLTLATSERIDRTQFPTINSMLLAAERGTGNEDVVRFLDQLNALKYTYAAALSRTGVNTVDAMRRFDQNLDTAWSKGQMAAALNQIQQTLAAERRGIDRTIALPGGGGQAPQSAPAAPQQVIKLDENGRVIQ